MPTEYTTKTTATDTTERHLNSVVVVPLISNYGVMSIYEQRSGSHTQSSTEMNVNSVTVGTSISD